MTTVVLGRIGRDVELRYTPGGQAVANISLAVNYGKKGADNKRPTQWYDAALWDKRAEALAPYLVKGQLVVATLVDVHIEEFRRGDGTTGTKLVARVDGLEFAGSPPDAAQQRHAAQQRQQAPQQRQAAQARQAPAPQPPAGGFDDFDDDIPF